MTLAAITWIEKELGILKTEVVAIEPEILAWAKNFLTGVTPILQKAAEDAVLAAVSFPGNGLAKAAAAFASASADLLAQGVPFVANKLKALIQIAYEALPASITGNTAAAAVTAAADNAVDKAAAKLAGTFAATTAASA